MLFSHPKVLYLIPSFKKCGKQNLATVVTKTRGKKQTWLSRFRPIQFGPLGLSGYVWIMWMISLTGVRSSMVPHRRIMQSTHKHNLIRCIAYYAVWVYSVLHAKYYDDMKYYIHNGVWRWNINTGSGKIQHDHGSHVLGMTTIRSDLKTTNPCHNCFFLRFSMCCSVVTFLCCLMCSLVLLMFSLFPRRICFCLTSFVFLNCRMVLFCFALVCWDASIFVFWFSSVLKLFLVFLELSFGCVWFFLA